MRLLIAGVLALLLASINSPQNQVGAPGEIHGLICLDGGQSIQMKDSAASRRSSADGS